MGDDDLIRQIDAAVEFTNRYPEALRPAILSFLLSSSTASISNEQERDVNGGASDLQLQPGNHDGGSSEQPAMTRSIEPPSNNGLDVVRAIAQDVGVSASGVLRVYSFGPDNKPSIRTILSENSIAKRQLAYSLLYLYAIERAGTEGATSNELREVVKAKKSYDSPNFTRNFKQSSFVQAYGAPGTATTEWLLTKNGRDEARRLIRTHSGASVLAPPEHAVSGDQGSR